MRVEIDTRPTRLSQTAKRSRICWGTVVDWLILESKLAIVQNKFSLTKDLLAEVRSKAQENNLDVSLNKVNAANRSSTSPNSIIGY